MFKSIVKKINCINILPIFNYLFLFLVCIQIFIFILYKNYKNITNKLECSWKIICGMERRMLDVVYLYKWLKRTLYDRIGVGLDIHILDIVLLILE